MTSKVTAAITEIMRPPCDGKSQGGFYALAQGINMAVILFELLDKLEFGGESPLTIRAWCSTFRYCPNPLGIVTAEQFDKLEFT